MGAMCKIHWWTLFLGFMFHHFLKTTYDRLIIVSDPKRIFMLQRKQASSLAMNTCYSVSGCGSLQQKQVKFLLIPNLYKVS